MSDPVSVAREVLDPAPGPIEEREEGSGAVLLRVPCPLRLLGGGGPFWTWEPTYPTALLAGHVRDGAI